MTAPGAPDSDADPLAERAVKLSVSILVLTWVTVVFGYGGWLALTVAARVFGYDPETTDGDLLRDRLLAWPDRNREVMRTDGRADLPLRP